MLQIFLLRLRIKRFPPKNWLVNNMLSLSQLDLAAQFVAAILVIFVRRFRQPAWRPLRSFLFSFMASSAFYPITYASFLHGYRQMDAEAGASRYLLTVAVYLTAVTIYAVSWGIPPRTSQFTQ